MTEATKVQKKAYARPVLEKCERLIEVTEAELGSTTNGSPVPP
jgi:hypothetical protein